MGSSFPTSAIFVKSRPKLSNTGVFDFGSAGLLGAVNGSSSSSLSEGRSALGSSLIPFKASYSTLVFSYIIPYLFNS